MKIVGWGEEMTVFRVTKRGLWTTTELTESVMRLSAFK